MNTRLVCKACGEVIPDEESVYAIRIMKVIHAICETCKNKIPVKERLLQSGSSTSGRTSMNKNVIEIHIAMRNEEKDCRLELCEVRLIVRKSFLKKKWGEISFNGTEA